VYQGLLDSKVLAEPKKAAQAAWEQWQQGMSVAQIATEREKPIQVWLCGDVSWCGSCGWSDLLFAPVVTANSKTICGLNTGSRMAV
jgi:hypothetical protein